MTNQESESRRHLVASILAKPWGERTPEEHKLAWDQYWDDVAHTDNATQAEIDSAMDQMLVQIYRGRTRPNIYADPMEDVDAA